MHIRPLAAAVSFALLAAPFAAQADTVKIAFIDPLSGPFAPVGQNQLHSFQTIAELATQQKWAGEHKIEVVGFDNKVSPQESLTQLKAVIDQGIRYITQGNGSGVGLALLRRGQQAQRAQSGQGGPVPELRRGRSGPDQQQVQLLALPLRRQPRHEDGGADHLHGAEQGHQEGLPDQPGLRVRPGGAAARPRNT